MTDESVLIVEDEAIVALSIEKRLKNLHITVIGTVATGEDAIAAVRQQAPDLILMDIHLHGEMDGIETARIIQDQYDIPVIFLTAYADDETIERAIEAGAYSYLVKPFGERDLHSSIKLVLSRRRAEQQLKDRQAHLIAKNRELEAFNYAISHELRGPLRTIDSYSSILLDICSDRLGEAGTAYLSRIQGTAKKMDDMIIDLLALSGLSRASLRSETVDVSRMAVDILDELARTHPGRKVRGRVQPGIVATADRSLLRRVCWNLIENAWKFTEKAEDAEIQVFTQMQGNARIFGVRDNGAGFDMTQAGHLFAPFHRLHPPAEYPGTGMGIATAQRIVHLHGGVIRAESSPSGTVVWFTLPMGRPASIAEEQQDSTQDPQNLQQISK